MTESKRRSRFSKENVLLVLGIATFVFEVIHAEVLGRPFHVEFLLAALALCGVSLTQMLDRR